MNTPEQSPNMKDYGFNQTDLWDLYLVKRVDEQINAGVLRPNEKEDHPDFNDMSNAEKYEMAETLSAGVFDEDMSQNVEWIDGEFDKVVAPESVEGHLNGQYRAQIKYLAIGQPDSPHTEGVVWVAFLFDKKNQKEIPNTRVGANKLSLTITGVSHKIPSWGNEVWKTGEELFKEEFVETVNWLNDLISHMDEKKEKHRDFMGNNPLLKEIKGAGNFLVWIGRKLSEIKNIKDTKYLHTQTQFLLEQLKDLQKELLNLFEDDEEIEKQYRDETDGWLPPPDWRT